MKGQTASRRLLIAAATILLLGGGASADDFLLLRDGSAWNRDEGKVVILWNSLPEQGAALAAQHPSGDSGISANLPAGAFDVATPPNPKPPPPRSNFDWRP